MAGRHHRPGAVWGGGAPQLTLEAVTTSLAVTNAPITCTFTVAVLPTLAQLLPTVLASACTLVERRLNVTTAAVQSTPLTLPLSTVLAPRSVEPPSGGRNAAWPAVGT